MHVCRLFLSNTLRSTICKLCSFVSCVQTNTSHLHVELPIIIDGNKLIVSILMCVIFDCNMVISCHSIQKSIYHLGNSFYCKFGQRWINPPPLCLLDPDNLVRKNWVRVVRVRQFGVILLCGLVFLFCRQKKFLHIYFMIDNDKLELN